MIISGAWQHIHHELPFLLSTKIYLNNSGLHSTMSQQVQQAHFEVEDEQKAKEIENCLVPNINGAKLMQKTQSVNTTHCKAWIETISSKCGEWPQEANISADFVWHASNEAVAFELETTHCC